MSIVNTESTGKTTIDTVVSNDDIPMWNSVQQTETPKRAAECGLLVYDNTAQQYKRLPDAADPIPYPVTQLRRSTDSSATVLQNAITSPANGAAYPIAGKDRLILSISGAATVRTVEFKAIGPGGVECYVLGSKVLSDGDIDLAASTTGITDEIWEFDDLSGYTSFYAKVTAVTGIVTVTVLGVA